jgi:hypothetical protein
MKMGLSYPNDPKPVLKEGELYIADNGRLICLQCAGASAKYTGHDISGQKVLRVTPNHRAHWRADMGGEMHCEGGCSLH